MPQSSMIIREAETDQEVVACYPVMRALRPHVAERDFVSRVRQQQQQGYRLAFVEADGAIVAVAGFRVQENLAWGRFLYIDDLVTRPEQRSQGYGAALLDWLRTLASGEHCEALHLDSGVQRLDAHRFYVREGMEKTALHFVEHLRPR